MRWMSYLADMTYATELWDIIWGGALNALIYSMRLV